MREWSAKENQMVQIRDFVWRHNPNAGGADGSLTWKIKPSAKVKIGDVAGKVRKDGYRTIRYLGRYFYAHRIAYEIGTGQFSGDVIIDHINGDRSDNRLANLRAADPSQSTANSKSRKSATGIRGVSFYGDRRIKRWCARISFRGRTTVIGYFETAEEAKAAYELEAARLFGQFKRG